MVWREQVAELIEQLDLKRKPVAVRYEQRTIPNPDAAAENLSACEAFLQASEGRFVRLSAANSSCSLGAYFLRLRTRSASNGAKAFEELLFDEEKANCFIEEVPPAQVSTGYRLPAIGDSLLLSPLETTEARPDLVLFICTFEQACKLIALDCHGAEAPAPMEMRGPICHRAITYPLVSGYLNVTLMSHASRRIHGYRADDLLVAASAERFERMLGNLAHLASGPPDIQIPDALRSLLHERCRATEN